MQELILTEGDTNGKILVKMSEDICGLCEENSKKVFEYIDNGSTICIDCVSQLNKLISKK